MNLANQPVIDPRRSPGDNTGTDPVAYRNRSFDTTADNGKFESKFCEIMLLLFADVWNCARQKYLDEVAFAGRLFGLNGIVTIVDIQLLHIRGVELP